MRHRLVFLKKYGSSNYIKIGDKKYKPTDETISWKGKSFPIPKQSDTFTDKVCSYVFIDFDNEKILSFIPNSIQIDAKFLDKLIAQNIIGQMVSKLRSGMEAKDKWAWMPFLAVFIIGCAVGYLFGTNPSLMGG